MSRDRYVNMKRPLRAIAPPQIARTAQKGTYVGKYEVLSGEALRKRRLSILYLDALVAVKIDIIPINIQFILTHIDMQSAMTYCFKYACETY